MRVLRSIAAFALIVLAALHAAKPARAADDTIVIAAPTDVQSWDPQATNATAQTLILRAVFDSPLKQDAGLKLIPALIKDWRWLGDDGLSLEVTLQDNIHFHNGDRLTTKDLRFSYIDRLRNEKATLQFAGVFNAALKDVEIVSDVKAIFRLNKPMPILPNWLGFLGQFIVPKDYFEKVGRAGFIEKPVGAGPYKLVDYQQGSRIVLEAFDGYWGEKPANKRVVFEIIKDATARVAAIEAGRVDLATAIPIREAMRLGQNPRLASSIELTSEILYLNAKNDGAYRDENVRLAAHHAINKEALSKAFFAGKAPAISGFGPPSMPGYPKDFSFSYDPELSKSLLAKSGYSKQNPVKIGFIATNGAFPNDYEVARAIVGMWAEVGIRADLQIVDLPKYYELSRGGKLLETALSVWANGTNDPELYIGTTLDPDSLFSVWKSDDMRDLIKPLLTETDQGKRIDGYAKASIYGVEKGYTMPLLQAVTTVVRKKELKLHWIPNTWYEPARISKAN